MKITLGVVALLVLGLALFVFWTPEGAPMVSDTNITNQTEEVTEGVTSSGRSVVTDGAYVINAAESQIRWAGKKPLIEGYINSGSLALTDGNIESTDGKTTGMFNIDMNTLSVSNTPTKPGKESLLETHLKSDGWFGVETYPTSSFVITEAVPAEDVDTSFTYTIKGNLTMKGQTHELEFPAIVYLDSAGKLNARADFEFDRTKWGITAGSGSFFDNLADNAIDDMVSLGFILVAERQ